MIVHIYSTIPFIHNLNARNFAELLRPRCGGVHFDKTLAIEAYEGKDGVNIEVL